MEKAKKKAVFVYEGARLHASLLRCPVIPARWEDREPEFRKQFITLVKDLCDGTRKFKNPKLAHDSWVQKYTEMGWKWGSEYNPEKKVHPDLVEYEELDPKEKIKDQVFLQLVEIARSCIW